MREGPTLRAPLMAMLAVVLCLCLISCSSDERGGRSGDKQRADAKQDKQTGTAKTEGAEKPSNTSDRPEPPAALVPVTHLGSTLENVSTEELAQARGLAVAGMPEASSCLKRPSFCRVASASRTAS